MQNSADTIHSHVASHRDDIMSFLRDIVTIPSFDSNIRDIAARVENLALSARAK